MKLFYLAAIATLTFGFPLAMEPLFAKADQSIVVSYNEEASQ